MVVNVYILNGVVKCARCGGYFGLSFLKLDISDCLGDYFSSEFRSKLLFLRKIAYDKLRSDVFGSADKVLNLSFDDFKRFYISLGRFYFRGVRFRVTPKNFLRVLDGFDVLELKGAFERGELRVEGNFSWFNLLGPARLLKRYWWRVRRVISFLLFGDTETKIDDIGVGEVVGRLFRVLEGDLTCKGFARGLATPLLLICDTKDRLGVWNNVSDEALHLLGLKIRTRVVRSTNGYVNANMLLNQLRDKYGFEDLADVDLFCWYCVKRSRGEDPFQI